MATAHGVHHDGEFLYSEAGQYAQPEVREAIERFRKLPLEKRAEIPLLWWLLQDSTQFFKMNRYESEYVSVSRKQQTCNGCDFIYYSVRHKVYICSQIQGKIEPSGWCRLWEHTNENPYR